MRMQRYAGAASTETEKWWIERSFEIISNCCFCFEKDNSLITSDRLYFRTGVRAALSHPSSYKPISKNTVVDSTCLIDIFY